MDAQSLGDEPFVQLTTFRRSGVAVPTTVWIVRDGTTLYVSTPSETGKVKRLRNSGRVELRPSNRFGRVDESVTGVSGLAEVHDDEQSVQHVHRLLRRKYGLQYRVIMGVERLVKPARRHLVLSITLT